MKRKLIILLIIAILAGSAIAWLSPYGVRPCRVCGPVPEMPPYRTVTPWASPTPIPYPYPTGNPYP